MIDLNFFVSILEDACRAFEIIAKMCNHAINKPAAVDGTLPSLL